MVYASDIGRGLSCGEGTSQQTATKDTESSLAIVDRCAETECSRVHRTHAHQRARSESRVDGCRYAVERQGCGQILADLQRVRRRVDQGKRFEGSKYSRLCPELWRND